MKWNFNIFGVFGKTGVCLPESRMRALWAAAGRNVNWLCNIFTVRRLSPPPLPPKWAELQVVT
jgi:hypothetical protein